MIEVFNILYNGMQFVFQYSSELDFSNSEEARNSFCMCPFTHRSSCKYDKPFAKIETYIQFYDREEYCEEQVITYQEFISLRNRLNNIVFPKQDVFNARADLMRHQINALGLKHHSPICIVVVTIAEV